MSRLADLVLGANAGNYRTDSERAAPAIDAHGIRLVRVQFTQTGTYNEEYLRPYIVSTTRGDLEEIADVVSQQPDFISSANISGIAGRMLQYNTRVDDRDLVRIEGGWDEPRLSFILEVIELQIDERGDATGEERVTFISGYTNCLDIATRGDEVNIAPDTVMFVSNLRRFNRRTSQIVTNTQLLVPSYHRDSGHRGRGNKLYTIRPRDVMSNEIVMNNCRGDSDDIISINSTTDFSAQAYKPSRASNLNPSTYLSASINALKVSESKKSALKGPFGDYRSGRVNSADAYSQAQSYLDEQRTYEANSFMQVLRNETSFNNDQTFTWDELRKAFGRDAVEDLTKVYLHDPVEIQHNVSYAGDCASWDESENGGRNAVIATVLKQTLPSYAMESMINRCHIVATNMLSRDDREHSVGGFRVEVSDPVFAGRFPERMQTDLIRDLEDSIALEVLRDVSINNEVDIDLIIDLDWANDSFFKVSVEGGDFIEFASGGFSNTLTSPIITNNDTTVETIGRDLKDIVNSVLRRN